MDNTPISEKDKLEAGPSNPPDTKEKELHDEKTNLDEKPEVKQTDISTAYRTTKRKRTDLSKLKYDYSRIQRVCRCFDEKDDMVKPIHYWFWPEDLSQQHSDNSSNSESETDEEKHDRKKRVDERYLTANQLQRRILHISRYLREKYNYCSWCGFQYDDENDLDGTCPGPLSEDHDGYSQTTFSDYEDD